MKLEKVLQNVESGLARVGNAIWQPDPLADVREEADRLSKELGQRQETLERRQAERATLEKRVCDQQNKVHTLTGHVRTCLACAAGEQAYQFALQLDTVRPQLETDQARLPQLAQVCWSLQFQIRQLERQLARLHEQLYPA